MVAEERLFYWLSGRGGVIVQRTVRLREVLLYTLYKDLEASKRKQCTNFSRLFLASFGNSSVSELIFSFLLLPMVYLSFLYPDGVFRHYQYPYFV